MVIQKFRDWIKNKSAQFEPTLYYPGGAKQICNVRRLKDSQIFLLGSIYGLRNPNKDIYKSASFRIFEFRSDLIHIDYEIMFIGINEEEYSSDIGSCEIDDIAISKDTGHVFAIKGINLVKEYA